MAKHLFNLIDSRCIANSRPQALLPLPAELARMLGYRVDEA